MTRYLVIFLLLFTSISLRANDHMKTGNVKIGERFQFMSKVLGEKQSYNIYLPSSYYRQANRGKRDPVLYSLDGHKNTFHMVSGIVSKLSRPNNDASDVPEMIIVALPSNNRFRDYTPTHLIKDFYGKNAPDWFDDTGGANAYLRMLETELIPEIHRRYRTENDLTFAGHSLGGLMALYDLIGGNRLFNRYIALDASWWYDNRLLERQLAKTNHLGDKPMHLFMVLASSPDPSHANTATSFEKTLKAKKFGNLRYTLQKLPTETHNSIDLQGYYHGLKWVFEGYNSPPEKE